MSNIGQYVYFQIGWEPLISGAPCRPTVGPCLCRSINFILASSLIGIFSHFANNLLQIFRFVFYDQNHWVFGPSPSSGILGNRKHDVSETGSVSVLRCVGGGGNTYSVGSLDRADINHWTTPVRFTQLFN
jgi:hypothetical protein